MQSIQREESVRPIKYFGFHNYNCGNEWKGALELAQCDSYSIQCLSSCLLSANLLCLFISDLADYFQSRLKISPNIAGNVIHRASFDDAYVPPTEGIMH